jgi:hypothetical protein
MGVGVLGERVGEGGDLALDGDELAEVAVEGSAAVGIEVEGVEPAEVIGGEEVAGGGFDEALVEDGVDTVFGSVAGIVGESGAASPSCV